LLAAKDTGVLALWRSSCRLEFASLIPVTHRSVVETPDVNGGFHLFLSLGRGSTIPIPKVNRDFFLSLSRESLNLDHYISLIEHFGNAFLRSQFNGSTIDLFSESLIGRRSSDFSGLIGPPMDRISVSMIFHILSHHLLRISIK
jgi:hypothetical protein